jgi:hypothetical protein
MRQRGVGKLFIDNDLFVVYFISSTRQKKSHHDGAKWRWWSLCWVWGQQLLGKRKVATMVPSDGDGAFAECEVNNYSAKEKSPRRCQVMVMEPLPCVRSTITRQRELQCLPSQFLCRVCGLALSKEGTFVECPLAWHSTNRAPMSP